ncbi:hypothetical protein [Adhaeribacter terreus]|uniref:Lipoprotein n=1 Tax=Adhaeribacter terreus TaxID=529703 RepID=A0ABW0E9S9_9BACT
MRKPGNLALFLLVIFFNTLILTSCKDKREPEPTGNIRASVSYSPEQDTIPCLKHYIPNGLKIELIRKDNNSILDIRSIGQNANLDFGQHPHGNYQLKVTGAIREGNTCTGEDRSHSLIDTLQSFTLEAPSKSVTFKITQ